MEDIFIAIILLAALVIGTETEQRDDHATLSNPASALPVSKAQSSDHERSADLCSPERPHMIQRNLTVPVDQQSSDDEH
jgi:hypothetical protein